MLARFTHLILPLCLVTLLTGCEKATSFFTRSTLPDTGPRIPARVQLEFDPALTSNKLSYINACNSPRELLVGEELESVMSQAAFQTFQTVYYNEPIPAGVKPDLTVKIMLQQSALQLQTDNLYDRIPADLTLEALAVYRDATGKVIREQPLKGSRREKLILEPTQHRCEYASIDAFLHDTTVAIGTQFIREARSFFEPAPEQAAKTPATSSTPSTAAAAAAASAPAAPSGLSFKATLLDENGNLILESGERIRLRVDVANAGLTPATGITVAVSGTASVIGQFPSMLLPIGTLQPGESRSVEFTGTLPANMNTPRAELSVSVKDAAGATLSQPQTVIAAIRSTSSPAPEKERSVDLNQIPALFEPFQRPRAYFFAIGAKGIAGTEGTRKYATEDVQLLSGYFQSLGGVPKSNTRILLESQATRQDIEEAMLDWLPSRINEEAVVIVYVAGQLAANASGEIFLVPGNVSDLSTSNLYPLKELQAGLSSLKSRLTLLLVDGTVMRLPGSVKGKMKPLQWEAGGGNTIRLVGTSGFQKALEPDSLGHGLFTTHLAQGLRGAADGNHDGEVSVGELILYVSKTVPPIARSEYHHDQKPLAIASSTATSRAGGLMLTRVSSGK